MRSLEIEAEADGVVVAPAKPKLKPKTEPVETAPGSRLLSRTQVLELLGVTYVTLYTWMREGKFPLALELGPPGGRSTKIAWRADEVHAWIMSRPRRQLRRPPTTGKVHERA